jgi:pimeloyl-ACP methyl ester carboxylesterase
MYPAWFADPELATLFTPPRSTSRTGAAVSARLRRDGYDWRDDVRGLPLPTLVIHGEDDLLPVAVARETAAFLPASRLALLPGAGHLPFWETPEPFFALVERFLDASA